MTNPKTISIKDYTYFLPVEKIAKYPLSERDTSKLLIYKEGDITEDIFKNISQYIPENSLMIFNNTKVVEARLLFQKQSGGTIEIFCLEPFDNPSPLSHRRDEDPVHQAFLQKEKVLWKCLIGGASKWKHGQKLEKKIKINEKEIFIKAKYIEKKQGSFIIEFSWSPGDMTFAELLHCAGAVPLPPYIKRPAEESDKTRYQTVYADSEGSVAAPTAGLHFTETVFINLKEKNIQTDFVTLHVSAGTFKPVKSETLLEHEMHAELIDISKSIVENVIKNADNNIVAVGTTSLRTIESLYWLGVKHYQAGSLDSEGILQWEAYNLAEKNIPVKDALESLLKWMDTNKLEKLVTKTQILIAPGYQFKIVNGLITNFHQPQSTLLLLVAAFIGKDWKEVYDFALQNNFRFLSYGDGSLLWRKKN